MIRKVYGALMSILSIEKNNKHHIYDMSDGIQVHLPTCTYETYFTETFNLIL